MNNLLERIARYLKNDGENNIWERINVFLDNDVDLKTNVTSLEKSVETSSLYSIAKPIEPLIVDSEVERNNYVSLIKNIGVIENIIKLHADNTLCKQIQRDFCCEIRAFEIDVTNESVEDFVDECFKKVIGTWSGCEKPLIAKLKIAEHKELVFLQELQSTVNRYLSSLGIYTFDVKIGEELPDEYYNYYEALSGSKCVKNVYVPAYCIDYYGKKNRIRRKHSLGKLSLE